jgi:alpha-galactosidase
MAGGSKKRFENQPYSRKRKSLGKVLYDIGFDRPETHAIRKDSNMYYAFYADSWDGEVELRGLTGQVYHITDYVNQKYLGKVKGPTAKLNVSFDKHLLVEAKPKQ